MCIRWVIHCEKNGIDHKFVVQAPAADPDSLNSLGYLSDRA